MKEPEPREQRESCNFLVAHYYRIKALVDEIKQIQEEFDIKALVAK